MPINQLIMQDSQDSTYQLVIIIVERTEVKCVCKSWWDHWNGSTISYSNDCLLNHLSLQLIDFMQDHIYLKIDFKTFLVFKNLKFSKTEIWSSVTDETEGVGHGNDVCCKQDSWFDFEDVFRKHDGEGSTHIHKSTIELNIFNNRITFVTNVLNVKEPTIYLF